jgi:hypothetical protein
MPKTANTHGKCETTIIENANQDDPNVVSSHLAHKEANKETTTQMFSFNGTVNFRGWSNR